MKGEPGTHLFKKTNKRKNPVTPHLLFLVGYRRKIDVALKVQEGNTKPMINKTNCFDTFPLPK